MDLHDSPEEAAFRNAARAWLAANAPRHELPARSHTHRMATNVEAAKAWLAVKAKAGWAGFSLPQSYGGRGGRALDAVLFAEEEARYNLPFSGAISNQHDILMPVLIAHYADAARTHIPRMLSGDEVWCQLFSEPGAGSDIAAISTRAVWDGDAWVISGQKTWNSGAHISQWGFLVARTDPDAPKHKGLTCFALDLSSPGVEIRAFRQANGHPEFNDVFFDEVRVPASRVIGEPNKGWGVIMDTLLSERRSMATLPAFTDDLFTSVLTWAGPAAADPAGEAGGKLVDWYLVGEGSRLFFQRILTRAARGQDPGPEVSVLKLVHGPRMTEICQTALDWAGEAALDPSHPLHWVREEFLLSFGMRIGGGTEDIMRNILGEQVLGLPPDVRVDKAGAYAQTAAMRGG